MEKQKVELTLNDAKKMYQSANKETKQHLENLFGKDQFPIVKDWTEITTLKDVCEAVGINSDLYLKDLEESGDTPDEIAYKILKLATKVINEGWVADPKNPKQDKWFGVFKTSPGFGFSHALTRYVHTCTSVGSRLFCETEKKFIHVATNFLSYYETYLTK